MILTKRKKIILHLLKKLKIENVEKNRNILKILPSIKNDKIKYKHIWYKFQVFTPFTVITSYLVIE